MVFCADNTMFPKDSFSGSLHHSVMAIVGNMIIKRYGIMEDGRNEPPPREMNNICLIEWLRAFRSGSNVTRAHCQRVSLALP